MSPDAIDSSRWTGRQEPGVARYLLADPTPHIFALDSDANSQSDASAALPDIFGQTAAVETLHDLCLEALGRRPDGTTGKRRTTTLALYGRYGQGKSTVLTRIRAALTRVPALNPPIRLAEFDVAAYRQDFISFEFDRLVSDWTFRPRFASLLIGLAVLTAICLTVATANPDWDKTVVAAAAAAMAIPWLVKSVRDAALRMFAEDNFARRVEAALRFGNRRDLALLLTGLWNGRPDVLIVDNLDRATVDQQRAFLRGLRRHRQNLPTVVIVAFDETPLTLADTSPEAPQELLAKVFTTAVRLYPMTQKDVLGIITHLLDKLEQECAQTMCSPLRFLRYPAVAGDLARILYAHRRHSVRFCYQFLNVAATASATLEIDHPADFSALMRLHGLFEFLPWIRHDPSALADMLAGNDAAGLLTYAAGLLGKDKLSSEVTAGVHTYLAITNHMQPYFADWHTFTGRFGLRATDGGRISGGTMRRYWFPDLSKAAATPDEVRTLWADWVGTDLKAAAEPSPARRRAIYQKVMHDLSIVSFQTGQGADRRSDDQEMTRERTVAIGFLIQRLWLADAPAGWRGLDTGGADTTGIELLLGDLPISAKGTEELLTDAEVRNAFLQITRSAPIGVMSYFAAIVASGSFRQGDLVRPSEGERRRLNLLEAHAGERPPGRLPSLLGKPLEPSRRAIHVVASLDPLEVPTDAATFDWPKVRRRIDVLGRLDRANCSGVLPLIRPFIHETVALHGREPSVLKELLLAMAAAFPAFTARDDGLWRRRTFDPFDPLAEALFDSISGIGVEICRGLSGSHITPHIILMALHYGRQTANSSPHQTFQCFNAALRRWKPKYPWPLSYLECIAEIGVEMASGEAEFNCDTRRAFSCLRFSDVLRQATVSLSDDPLDRQLAEALSGI